MQITRRTFLQQASLALLTLGVGNVESKQAWAAPLFDRYLSTLAQPSARKLALLVGVNEYPHGTNLSGCATDVELQRELLINRFGFNSQNILTLTGQQATRGNIEAAFTEHLTQQAVADDVVVFHFSGYGSKVQVPQPSVSGSELAPSTANGVKASLAAEPAYRLANSLVPRDGVMSAQGQPTANDLLEETLLLLAQGLATDKLTIVLDTSYKSTEQMLLGNLRVRSYPKRGAYTLNPEALAFQAQLRQTNAERQVKQSKKGLIPGMILAAAAEDQIATEGMWHGARAGVFTYALTQSLWQATPASTVLVSMGGTAEQVERITDNQQQPQLKGGGKQPLFTYYQVPETLTGAEGVITAIDDRLTAQILLAGLPGAVVENYGNSCFTLIVPPEGQSLPRTAAPGAASPELVLQMRSQEGLKAKARLIAKELPPQFSLQPGQLVREKIRVLPRNVELTIALDNALERIERVDATSAFSSIDVVSSVVAAGEQAADCLFGRLKEDGVTTENGYSLFSVAGVPLANTTGKATEAVKLAVKRLAPELETQLAAKLWRLTNNEGSSGLQVKARLRTVEPKGQSRTIIRRETRRQSEPQTRYKALSSNAEKSQQGASNPSQPLAKVSSSTEIQYWLENQGDRPLYLMLLGLDSGGNALALYSPKEQEESPANGSQYRLGNRRINPGETLTIPQPGDSINWVVAGAAGIAEIQLIFSQAPFSKTLKMLSARPHLKGDKEQVLEIPNPLEVARALLQDLDAASQVSSDLVSAREDNYALDVNAWAGLSFIYQVV